MNSKSMHDPRARALFIETIVHDSDMKTILDERVIVAEVRHLIAKEVVSRIMSKLGPTLDDVFGDLKELTKPALTLEEARATGCCRLCGKPSGTRYVITNDGKEFAHMDCLEEQKP